jgi:hypothetical protein
MAGFSPARPLDFYLDAAACFQYFNSLIISPGRYFERLSQFFECVSGLLESNRRFSVIRTLCHIGIIGRSYKKLDTC